MKIRHKIVVGGLGALTPVIMNLLGDYTPIMKILFTLGRLRSQEPGVRSQKII
jgi:hypothetical protein